MKKQLGHTDWLKCEFLATPAIQEKGHPLPGNHFPFYKSWNARIPLPKKSGRGILKVGKGFLMRFIMVERFFN